MKTSLFYHDTVFLGMVLGTILGVCHAAPGLAAVPRGPHTVSIHWDAYEQIWHVSQTTGSDAQGDGSQRLPWRTIQQALAHTATASIQRRHAILVAGGRYARQTLAMHAHVDLFGGFDPITWKRDIWKQPSILDGAGTHRILQGASQARLDGFTLQGGAVRGPGASLFCDHTSPRISNNRFFNNRTQKPSPWKPLKWHEKAHDGGAIYGTHGAQPVIQNNLFADNETEIGRGAAIALHDHSGGKITNNVFFRNRAGLSDSMRSSDGGAVSVFRWSSPDIVNNLFLHNQALHRNDGGGLFVALWSSPVISQNLFVDNFSGDDACALFVGGQEHRYGEPQDPTPGEKKFFVRVTNNLFVHNLNQKKNGSSVRFTMEGRGTILNNLLACNGRFAVEKSAASVINNTVLGNTSFEEEPQSLKIDEIANNIFWGNLTTQRRLPINHSIIRDGYPGSENLSQQPRFLKDQLNLHMQKATFDAQRLTTRVLVSSDHLPLRLHPGRVVHADDRWGVVDSCQDGKLTLWGDFSKISKLEILPSFQRQSESPGIDKGTSQGAPDRDRLGNSRPLGKGIDIGADEFAPSHP